MKIKTCMTRGRGRGGKELHNAKLDYIKDVHKLFTQPLSTRKWF